MNKNETLEHALSSVAELTARLDKVSPLMELATLLTDTAVSMASTGNFELATKMLILSSDIMDVANIDLVPK
jgi:hypothetical protein